MADIARLLISVTAEGADIEKNDVGKPPEFACMMRDGIAEMALKVINDIIDKDKLESAARSAGKAVG